MIITEFLKEEIRIPSPPSLAVRILDAVKIDGKSFDDRTNLLCSYTVSLARNPNVLMPSLLMISSPNLNEVYLMTKR
jgi:hypothetical protein